MPLARPEAWLALLALPLEGLLARPGEPLVLPERLREERLERLEGRQAMPRGLLWVAQPMLLAEPLVASAAASVEERLVVLGAGPVAVLGQALAEESATLEAWGTPVQVVPAQAVEVVELQRALDHLKVSPAA